MIPSCRNSETEPSVGREIPRRRTLPQRQRKGAYHHQSPTPSARDRSRWGTTDIYRFFVPFPDLLPARELNGLAGDAMKQTADEVELLCKIFGEPNSPISVIIISNAPMWRLDSSQTTKPAEQDVKSLRENFSIS